MPLDTPILTSSVRPVTPYFIDVFAGGVSSASLALNRMPSSQRSVYWRSHCIRSEQSDVMRTWIAGRYPASLPAYGLEEDSESASLHNHYVGNGVSGLKWIRLSTAW